MKFKFDNVNVIKAEKDFIYMQADFSEVFINESGERERKSSILTFVKIDENEPNILKTARDLITCCATKEQIKKIKELIKQPKVIKYNKFDNLRNKSYVSMMHKTFAGMAIREMENIIAVEEGKDPLPLESDDYDPF